MSQSGKIRELMKLGLRDDEIVKKYAAAERRGEVLRKSNKNGLSPEAYARKRLANVRYRERESARKAATRAKKSR